ncbi:alkaline phosphatase family protein [Micromonospora sp. FIMYZ51]|uniref:alkaline phosphatase family protein n=1 Tax=Micromonospora sp. FIMYZ51 TaxID=3051832 RepID=UPI00311E6BCE
MGRTGRLAVIGLDGVAPQLIFDRYADDMPTLTALRSRSLWGPLTSVVPPITVPAWSCMMSGRSPGEIGIYGFRNRADHSYERLSIATSRSVRVPRIWDMVGAAGGDSVVLGVPGTYPPSAVKGCLVSCFLAPSTETDYTWPTELGAEIHRLTNGYLLDVTDFRTDDKARISQQIFDLSEQRFTVARYLARTRPWTFFSFVDMGPDRLHHGFWRYCDPEHPAYRPGNPFETIFRDYYRALDRHLAAFLTDLDDDTTVVIASDHGAQPMVGGFHVNEWLRRRGLLVLAEQPPTAVPISQCRVDWRRTTAWAEGGYYGRIFLNVAGREPQGTVPPSEYEHVRDLLSTELAALADHRGRPMGTRVIRPEDVYPQVEGVPPDLIVYFGDLRWRAAGTIGPTTDLYSFENDTGPDDANHAEQGVLVLAGDRIDAGYRAGMSLLDVAPTIQSLLGLPAVPEQRGRALA